MKRIIIYQRVLPEYRYTLLKELSKYYYIQVIATRGQKTGAQKSCMFMGQGNYVITYVKSLSFTYKGKRRKTFIPFYPHHYFTILNYDLVVLEGTTNIINNIFLIPLCKLFKKKTIWWDSGYSEEIRTRSRIIKDSILSYLIKYTDMQMAYSNIAKEYMSKYMGAANCFTNTNTISSNWFINNKDRIFDSIHKKDHKMIHLLYVGSIEKRKLLLELIDTLDKNRVQYNFTIIGNGEAKAELVEKTNYNKRIILIKGIWSLSDLFNYYSKANIFVLPGEGGLAIIQAMLFGLPVITSRADGTAYDYIKNKHNGFISTNIDDIVERIIEFSKYSEETKQIISINALNSAYELNSNQWVSKLKNKIESLIKE